MSLAKRNKIGVLYGTVTVALLAATLGSGQCWQSQVGPWSNEGLHDNCLFIWVVSGVLLTLSQIVFIWVAFFEVPASVTRVVILLFGIVILLAIALFIVALSGMPS
jgi:hypothetical protein